MNKSNLQRRKMVSMAIVISMLTGFNSSFIASAAGTLKEVRTASNANKKTDYDYASFSDAELLDGGSL